MASGGKKGEITSASTPVRDAGSPITNYRNCNADVYTTQLLQELFPNRETISEASSEGTRKALNLSNLPNLLQTSCEEALAHKASTPDCHSAVKGRLGPTEVKFDITSNVGTFIVEPDALGISSLSNFSTLRANCCLYKGKWMYEVMLGSKGVMQIGWCTINCKFSQEDGVGDTVDSYAYDGSRLRKWNVKTQKYGELWLTGDVITCTIDCDNGILAFYRNGNFLGDAFKTLRRGPGYAYFPAISLSLTENLRANFGATPFRYPVEGYRALQDPPTKDVVHTQHLLGYIDTLLPVITQLDQELAAGLVAGKSEDTPPPPLTEFRTHKSTSFLVAAHIFDKLSPYLRNAYVVEACLLKFLMKLNDPSAFIKEQTSILKMLDLMWTFMQDFEIKPCLEHLMVSLLSSYRFSPVKEDFKQPKEYLTLLLAILRHHQTRRFLLEHVLFEKIKFPIFMHIKPPDDAGLAEMVPTVWWEKHSEDDAKSKASYSPEEKSKGEAYLSSCERLGTIIEELEQIQVEILKTLLYHKDLVDSRTSRLFFIEKFRIYLKENSNTQRVTHQLNTCPLPVNLCFFHRMVQVLRYYWDEFQQEDPSRFVPSSEAFMPIQEFWSDSREYFDLQRCGGSMTHLNKILGSEVNKAQGIVVMKDGQVVKIPKLDPDGEVYPETEMPSGNSLMEILDGVIILYHIAAHKQLSKMSTLRENMREFVASYHDTTEKLTACPEEMADVHSELMTAQNVFVDKIYEQARQMAWVIAVIYAKQKREDVAWLLGVALKTVEKASTFKQLFQYMPEFYLEIVINSFNALKNFFHPTLPFDSLPGYENLMKKFATFLTRHFADGRIVITDARDNIIQALACFTCYEKSLQVLETLPLENRTAMVKALMQPYENRSWAQTNWILVRIWKGCGFGFRYTHLPHLVPSKVQLTDFGSASLQKPCPSQVFQHLLSDILQHECEAATRFLDTLLGQLNWSFSEFIGMMQEIQQALSRSDQRVAIETRQLKICGTCFEISVCLFRVLEMVVSIAPQLFTDWSKPSAELLMKRLIQLLCQVLNRITMKSGVFETVVSMYITGLESVTHYPILSVVAGILTHLLLKTDLQSKERTTMVLLSDASFQMKSLEFMLGVKGSAAVVKDGLKEKPFNFKDFNEVSGDEVKSLESVITYLQEKQETFVRHEEVIKDEDLCFICYASPKGAVFKPCGHQSCRTCISQHLLSKKDCFFCKTQITAVEDLHGQPIVLDSPIK